MYVFVCMRADTHMLQHTCGGGQTTTMGVNAHCLLCLRQGLLLKAVEDKVAGQWVSGDSLVSTSYLTAELQGSLMNSCSTWLYMDLRALNSGPQVHTANAYTEPSIQPLTHSLTWGKAL